MNKITPDRPVGASARVFDAVMILFLFSFILMILILIASDVFYLASKNISFGSLVKLFLSTVIFELSQYWNLKAALVPPVCQVLLNLLL